MPIIKQAYQTSDGSFFPEDRKEEAEMHEAKTQFLAVVSKIRKTQEGDVASVLDIFTEHKSEWTDAYKYLLSKRQDLGDAKGTEPVAGAVEPTQADASAREPWEANGDIDGDGLAGEASEEEAEAEATREKAWAGDGLPFK